MAAQAPLYAQVEQSLLSRIGVDWSAGDRLPTEDELIQQFGVSRITVRRAVQNLVARGLVETRRGQGTFVARTSVQQPLAALTGFVEDMQAHGIPARARVLSVEEVDAPAEVRAALELPLGARVTHIERVRLALGAPMSFDSTYLPVELGRLVGQDDLENEQIFTLLEERHDTPLFEASYAIRAINADERVARALEVPLGSAVLQIERITVTTDQRPVDHEFLHYRGDAITFTTRLPRQSAQDPR
ncbi:MAG TPA: GntR family transcriptional regulator [Candidatus Avipropionibacterium avicola]|uniref:GntR family transcriptional regulator n=1 Tax=Candidatus Avipropionibacterium avicola TaxID=2840701 RepID=A0A9D1H0N3_9ACTN|nr:GntR family transcriptional regulator [Candidatus Avipropionibacterium avicola]